ncbi:MAG: diacylglycerol kinase family protein [Pseudomonadota bacterium]
MAVVVNPKAGQVDVQKVRDRIEQALFRCDLRFFCEADRGKMGTFIKDQIKDSVEYVIVVGGDGTLNITANELFRLRGEGLDIPPICIVSSGTANDLGHEMGVHIRIDRAARAIYSGTPAEVDLLEVEANGEKSYMLTNGGIGLAASAAKGANVFRSKIFNGLGSKNPVANFFSQVGAMAVENMGSNIYNLMLVKNWVTWDKNWEISLEDDSFDYPIVTKSPFILVNNQKRLAQKFHTAPTTNNNDGTFNYLVINHSRQIDRIKDVYNMGRGRWVESQNLISKETQYLKIKSLNENIKMTFFGDGEILQDGVTEISVRCIHPGLRLIVDRGAS